MSAQVTTDGVEHQIEKRSDGVIRVSHSGGQFNALNGPDTGGEHFYLVHPCQRQQYEFWNQQLPPLERASPDAVAGAVRAGWC
jgi:hypothetical protein